MYFAFDNLDFGFELFTDFPFDAKSWFLALYSDISWILLSPDQDGDESTFEALVHVIFLRIWTRTPSQRWSA